MPMTITLPPEIEKRLDALAVKTGCAKTDLLQQLVENNLDDMESYFRGIEIRDRVRAGQEQTFTDAEVRDELGLDG